MVYAVISDIHANKEAFQVVLADIKEKDITEVCCTGDIIGYGPDPYSCTQDTRKHCRDRITKGNHELALQRVCAGKQVLMHDGPKQGIDYANKKLWKSQKRFLTNLPVELHEGARLFMHGNPAPNLQGTPNPQLEMIAKINDYILWKDDYVGRSNIELTKGGLRKMSLQPTDEARITAIFDVMRSKGIQTCFLGHLHVGGVITDLKEEDFSYIPEIMLAHRPLLHKTPQEPETFTIEQEPGKIYIVLCGAVGQPRDWDNRACYVIVDDNKIIWRRLPYNF
jgi:hypothetical protein